LSHVSSCQRKQNRAFETRDSWRSAKEEEEEEAFEIKKKIWEGWPGTDVTIKKNLELG
jgi:hypothetical protein